MLTRQLHLDVKGSAVFDSVAPDVRFAMMANVHQSAIFRVELTNCVVTGHAAVLAERHDNLVL